ncbi:hypothetical protein RS130_14285 [Paraglaciecola aquimarina]|uniref:2'-5' RNA ligase n=1 Tax=Paraglaciecola aquimarina TaxID=1235557 RepID=A0ABU3SY33_9ALTE|nr:hypothetical protein [Paraglaciecola aquimarina]MDU0354922.1 hypothetical protein [Paraglaciecola aquimarina]
MNEHYEKMWRQGMAAFEQQKFNLDKQIGSLADTRRGITLLARLSQPVKNTATQFLTELNEICPAQYCYPQTDIHLTIMSIVSCHSDYIFDAATANQYLVALQQQLVGMPIMTVDFTGITVSDAAVLLTGYTSQEYLMGLRSKVRETVLNAGLHHSMDSRYRIETAHSTIFRFCKQPENSQDLIQFLQRNKHRKFGDMRVDSLELVFNDWYQTEAHTKLIGKIKL